MRDRVRAYVRAADICARHLSQPEQAIDALRAAWMLDPGNGVVFDALSAGGRVTVPVAPPFWGGHFGMLVDRFGVPWMVSCE